MSSWDKWGGGGEEDKDEGVEYMRLRVWMVLLV